MTNREILFKIQSVEPLIEQIKERAEIIINNTIDPYIQTVIDINVFDTYVEIFYDYCRYGEWLGDVVNGECGKDCVKIPMEWFYEGFDYKAAYKELTQL